MGFYSGGLIIERIFASEIWGAYFREGLLFLWRGGGGGGGGANYRNFMVFASDDSITIYNGKMPIQIYHSYFCYY